VYKFTAGCDASALVACRRVCSRLFAFKSFILSAILLTVWFRRCTFRSQVVSRLRRAALRRIALLPVNRVIVFGENGANSLLYPKYLLVFYWLRECRIAASTLIKSVYAYVTVSQSETRKTYVYPALDLNPEVWPTSQAPAYFPSSDLLPKLRPTSQAHQTSFPSSSDLLPNLDPGATQAEKRLCIGVVLTVRGGYF
jgi:hypothetical protein